MTRLVIIGAGGVGKAHAIAALNLGWEISLVVDTNPKVLYEYKELDTLTNVWGDFRETACYPNDARPTVMTSIQEADSMWASCDSNDIIVIATPNDTHASILKYIHSRVSSDTKILVEKPYQSDLNADNIFVSAEWLYHDLLNTKTPIEYIGFCHNNYDPKIHTDLVSDLGFHLLSILYKSIGDDLLYSLNHIERIGRVEPSELYRAVFLTLVDAASNNAKNVIGIKLAYNPIQQGINNFLGLPSNHPSEIKICYANGTVALDWQQNLFELQLQSLVNGTHLITSKLAILFDILLKDISNAT